MTAGFWEHDERLVGLIKVSPMGVIQTFRNRYSVIEALSPLPHACRVVPWCGILHDSATSQLTTASRGCSKNSLTCLEWYRPGPQ